MLIGALLPLFCLAAAIVQELLLASEGRRSYLAGVREATLLGAKGIVDNIKAWMKTFPGNETVFHEAERAAFLREVAEAKSRLEDTQRMEWVRPNEMRL